MQVAKKKIRPIWIVLIILGLCALAWAVSELSGQANKSAADAGMAAADFEMASFETIKPAQDPPPCDWALEKKLRQDIEKLDAEYRKHATKAQSEAGGSKGVSDGTKKAVLDAAAKFKAASDEYAKMWDACNCKTRAKLARETGASRVASANLLVSGADSDKAKAVNKQHAELNKARNEYVKEAVAKNELSEADKKELKSSLVPRSQKLVTDTANLTTQISKLLDQAKAEGSKATGAATGGKIGIGSISAAKGSVGGAAALTNSLTSMLSLAQNMAKNADSLKNDVVVLTK